MLCRQPSLHLSIAQEEEPTLSDTAQEEEATPSKVLHRNKGKGLSPPSPEIFVLAAATLLPTTSAISKRA